MQCKRCPSYEVTLDPEGITWRRCRWDGHQVFGNMECDAHSIKIKAFCEVKEEMRKETHHMDSGYKYKAFINGEWHDLTLSDSPNELTEWLQSNEEWTRVKHGHWVVDEDGNIKCSECGHCGVGDNYCERCGAKMDGERGKLMTNAEVFRNDFGFYATELWAMTQAEFLEWLNADCDREKPNAIHIVRCKDCVCNEDGWCYVQEHRVAENEFCSWGERREDDNK